MSVNRIHKMHHAHYFELVVSMMCSYLRDWFLEFADRLTVVASRNPLQRG